MKTYKKMEEFIEQLKNTSPEIPADTVKSLIDTGKSSPFVAKRSFQPRRIKQMFNPLKIIIMTTFIVIVTSIMPVLNPFGRKTSDLRNESSDERLKTVRLEGSLGANPVHHMSKDSETITKPKREPAGSSIQSYGVTPKNTEKPILDILPHGTVLVDTSHDPDNTLWLNSKIFECLGFSFDQGGFSLPFIDNNKWRTFSLGVKGKEGFTDFPD